MKKLALFLIAAVVALGGVYADSAAAPEVVQCAANGKGLLCRYQNKNILFLEGTPEEIGTAHGQLRAKEIKGMSERIMLVAAGYLVLKDDWFFDRITEVMRRTKSFTPARFYSECDAMSAAAGVSAADGRQINFFPEIFHCSGVAVRGNASVGGQVIHARVLDYMRDIGLQKYAQLTIMMPKGYHAWVNVSYAGFVGTVTAMNDQGLAMGEMGGGGVGKWDGLPMSFMMRRVMEECSTVDEALALMRKVPLTCDYYYVLSDKHKTLAGVAAIAGTPLQVLHPGEQNPQLPPVPADTVFISGGNRAKELSAKLQKNFGRIDAAGMIEIIKRPVAMKSNLHDAIFLPESGTLYFADAGKKTPACDEPYVKVNLGELLAFYRTAMKIPAAVGK